MSNGVGDNRLNPARRAGIAPFQVMEVQRAVERRRTQGLEVLPLHIGEPGDGPPRAVIEAGQRALERASLGYTDAKGIEPLRRAIAQHYVQRHGLVIDPQRVLVTAGASAGLVLAALTAFDAGGSIAIPRPGYPGYRNILSAVDVTVVDLPCGAAQGYRLDLASLPAVAGILLGSPANPTGTCLSADELRALAAWQAERGGALIVDEIYHGLSFGEHDHCALAFAPNALVLNGFSKYFSMTGFRLGWMVLPERLLRAAECLAQNLYICASTISQHAALAAFDCYDELDRRVARYRDKRATVLDALHAMGLTEHAPAEGAFYVYLDIRKFGVNSHDFVNDLLDKTGVALTPGHDFDPRDGAHTVRLSYAASEHVIERAMQRLGDYVQLRACCVIRQRVFG